MPLPKKLAERTDQIKPKVIAKEPLWKGPIDEGITFSMLNRFMSCRERFRITVIDGVKPEDKFNHKIEYGHLWHAAEEATSGGKDWKAAVRAYYDQLVQKYKHLNCVPEITKWMQVCMTQYPIYLEYWKNHPDNITRVPVFQEYSFNLPYDIGNGVTVRLRGKIDAGDVIGKGKFAKFYVQENKSKGDIDEDNIKRQLSFDAQTMLYLVASREIQKKAIKDGVKVSGFSREFLSAPIGGVRYNVIRRPLSGGKGTIVQRKQSKSNPDGESAAEFYARLAAVMDGTGKNRNGDDTPGPEYFFMRWQVDVTDEDITRFEERYLKPILRQLCEWYQWVSWCKKTNQDSFGSPEIGDAFMSTNKIHWQHPFGMTNMINEGFVHDLDEYMRSGSMLGMRVVDKLFEEL